MIDPSKPMKEYTDLMQQLQLPIALMGGTSAMRAAGETFLPRAEREDIKDYQARIGRSFLFGGFERTVSILTGEIHDKAITLADGTPKEFEELAFNIDTMGRNLTRFSKEFTEHAIINGTGHILIDVQPLPKDDTGKEIPTTKAEDKKLNRRPYWIHVPATALLGVKLDSANQLAMIRIAETVKEEDGLYDVKSIDQVRVVTPGAWEIHRQDKQTGDWYLHDQGKTPLKKIALVTLWTGKKISGFTAKPPLTGLAELNHQHWVSSSDQNNILHVCRVPILFGKCLSIDDNGKVIVSVQNLINSQQPEGDLKYVEHSGAAMADGWKDLQQIKEAMSLWGLELISSDRSGDVTATERAMTGAKTGSFLNAVALDLQDVLTSAIALTMEMLGAQMDGGAVVNTDFSLSLNSFDVNTLTNAFKMGILDRATVIQEMKRRGLIGESADPVEIAAAIMNEKSVSFGGF